ncbi:TRAP transporter large permease [Salisediminibacterium halotolerans]|uniref:C4-dicarboxylate transporter, DctM subunit n=1 Tax=Salisediminibacterium halotolerans TaxID=517425 RepID=A0A1H9UBP5_9BACI|nr:TRAP transporter large permease [Salisediminibacterium haloalkalitolerans]SES06752.1 C4-dicarboxylate transporter, DctM subunit [Salisediminibacterium haloalkalitolerans]
MIWLIPLLFILILLRIPIAFALGFVALLGIVLTDISLLVNIPRQLYNGIESFTLIAVPLFILAGEIMTKGGMSKRLIRFSQMSVGFMPGGMAMVIILASMFFSALTGTAIAAAAAIGGMLIPAMKDQGHDVRFTSSLVASSATIGPIIPPSIVLILYGVIASVSISDLFVAGILPGILMGVGLMVYSVVLGIKDENDVRTEVPTFKEFLWGFKDAILALIMPIIILGGIISGIFTPTESGVIAVVYALIIGTVVYRDLPLKNIPSVFLDAGKTTATIVFLIGSASVFIWLLSFHNIPQQLIDMLGPVADNPIMLLLLINIILLLAGTFIDTISAVSIFTPLFLPLVLQAGIDPIHFGIILAVNLTIGMVTPPLGVTLFVTARIADIKVPSMFKFLIPQISILLVVLLVVTYLPEVIMYFPENYDQWFDG